MAAAALIAVLALALPARGAAQLRSVAEGLRVNIHAAGAQLGDGGASMRGVRPGYSASYGNTRSFAAFFTYDRVPMNDGENEFRLRHMDAGVRVHLRGRETRVVPFALGAYTWRNADFGSIVFLGDTQTVNVHGAGFTIGAGAQYYISPRFAAELSAKRSGGAMDRVRANDFVFPAEEAAIRGATLRLNVGLSFWPAEARPR